MPELHTHAPIATSQRSEESLAAPQFPRENDAAFQTTDGQLLLRRLSVRRTLPCGLSCQPLLLLLLLLHLLRCFHDDVSRANELFRVKSSSFIVSLLEMTP